MPHTVLWWTSRGLAGTVWASSSLFGLYILIYYALAAVGGDMGRWNGLLPDLFVDGGTAANTVMGLHFLGGGLLLVLGNAQFIAPLRRAAPGIHRLLGRVYVASAFLAGLGGLLFIALRGCVGGPVMDLGFAGYGLLMLVAAAQTVRHAIARDLVAHRAWAVRSFTGLAAKASCQSSRGPAGSIWLFPHRVASCVALRRASPAVTSVSGDITCAGSSVSAEGGADVTGFVNDTALPHATQRSAVGHRHTLTPRQP
jgi:uncharacterized membrane protein